MNDKNDELLEVKRTDCIPWVLWLGPNAKLTIENGGLICYNTLTKEYYLTHSLINRDEGIDINPLQKINFINNGPYIRMMTPDEVEETQ